MPSNEGSTMSDHRTVNVYLTTGVIAYLYEQTDVSDIEATHIGEDLVITKVDGAGGCFVESASSVGDEGSGVWIDAVGHEHQEPGHDFVTSDKAQELMEIIDPDGSVDPYSYVISGIRDLLKHAEVNSDEMSESEYEVLRHLDRQLVMQDTAVGQRLLLQS